MRSAHAARRALEESGRWPPSPSLGELSAAAPAVAPADPGEPLIDAGQVQAHVLAGFSAPLAIGLFLRIEDVGAARRWLRRAGRAVTPLAAAPAGRAARGGVALAFGFDGLARLTGDAWAVADIAFKQGMLRRTGLLGDPCEPAQRGHPSRWAFGGPGRVPDVFVLVAGAGRAELATGLAKVAPRDADGVRPVFVQQCAALHGPYGPREHFGFRDPVSQPGLRGGTSPGPQDLLTPRADPGDPDHGERGQRLVWPGEFVFGYPAQDAMDLTRPGPVAHGGPAWTRNGSLLVVRRLEQDVAAFRRFVAATAAAVGTTAERMAAQCFGRWPSGSALAHAPDADDPELGADAARNNDFGFAADPLGALCPLAAHIRKAYLRDHATSPAGRAGVETHRLLRRSVGYGPPYPIPGERGLLFMAYQTSIERQFEFVMRAWLNNPCLRDGGDGHDPIAGQNGRDAHRRRRFALRVPDDAGCTRTHVVTIDDEWVRPTGGGYFFAPSIDALALLAA